MAPKLATKTALPTRALRVVAPLPMLGNGQVLEKAPRVLQFERDDAHPSNVLLIAEPARPSARAAPRVTPLHTPKPRHASAPFPVIEKIVRRTMLDAYELSPDSRWRGWRRFTVLALVCLATAAIGGAAGFVASSNAAAPAPAVATTQTATTALTPARAQR